ncbi:MAG TPA: diaminopimelate epimerase [Flavobacteriaceae bacterium]|nr:diaminopimelate epimerase [Flavobacteriaceae bacterium]
MKHFFYKYQGAGNDFVLIDDRTMNFKKDAKLVRGLCDRKFGIGADGLILLQNPIKEGEDFKMVYFNADGNEASMCGNGARCISAFAKHLGVVAEKAVFSASDGSHQAVFDQGLVRVQMQNVSEITKTGDDAYFLDTGSPHYVLFTSNIDEIEVKTEGRKIRNNETYRENGVNVNFVSLGPNENKFFVRTYERGVEDETLSCGTGATAVALAAHFSGKTGEQQIFIETPGGKLSVAFEAVSGKYKNIWLTGPVELVFKGEIEC